MDASRLDRLTRIFAAGASRRGVLRSLASAGLGVVVSRTPGAVEARKKKPKKLMRNSYGCVDVGLACRGNSGNCCSGICEGKKPKKGKKDRSQCVAHTIGNCPADQVACAVPGTLCGPMSVCVPTTGKACYCAALGPGACAVCRKDAECVALGWGPDSACTVVGAGCSQSGGTYCALPGA
jgi:hypothetical protein